VSSRLESKILYLTSKRVYAGGKITERCVVIGLQYGLSLFIAVDTKLPRPFKIWLEPVQVFRPSLCIQSCMSNVGNRRRLYTARATGPIM